MQLQEALACNVAHQAPQVVMLPPGLPAPDAKYKMGELCSQTLVRVQHMELYCYHNQFPEHTVPILSADTHGAKLWFAVVEQLKQFVEKGGATMKQVKHLKEQLIADLEVK